METVKIPSWDFGNNIVEAGFKAGSSGHGGGIRDGRQGYAQGQLCSNEGKWISETQKFTFKPLGGSTFNVTTIVCVCVCVFF